MTGTPGGGIAITPDGNTLLVTSVQDINQVHIFQAPFSASSVPADLTIPGGVGLNGIAVNPAGTAAIVVSSATRQADAIMAPFGAGSVVQTIPLPAGGGTAGFEDVGISADGQLAIVTGNGTTTSDLAVLIRAPFGTAATTSLIPVNDANPARGGGAVRFLPPGLGAGICSPPAIGLVSAWSGDGNALDARSRNNGTIENGVAYAPGHTGQAFDLSGNTGDRILVGNPPNLRLMEFTIEAWVKRSSAAVVTNSPGARPVFFLHTGNPDTLFLFIRTITSLLSARLVSLR